ncbi:signal peptide peptidase SppA [Carnobacterium mobile]|uniref:signal peptide peptidase SppA n=1 Tax=Carnobacterium mobile TaxID=2750 RepID=UPI001867FDC3|nr:signal peptide peptidase SppA [Carnobacterium mobile]
MTTKRWTAIGLAIGLFILSFVISGMVAKVAQTDKAENIFSDATNRLLGQSELIETVVTTGDEANRVALLTVDGTILAGQSSGLWSTTGYDHNFFLEQLEAVKADKSVKAILLSINSPGGGTYESAQIKDSLLELKETTDKPIYVSMGNLAASGGYYIAAPADKIFAAEETLTGSIGVIMSSTNLSELYEKLGIEDTTIKSGRFKDIGSNSRPMTEADQEILQKMVDSSYDRFVKVVAEGRKMNEKQVRELADGRIYDGAQALEAGLVDEIGYQEDALEALQEDYQLKNAEVFQYSTGTIPFSSLMFSKASQLFSSKNASAELVEQITSQFGTSAAPKMLYLYGGE